MRIWCSSKPYKTRSTIPSIQTRDCEKNVIDFRSTEKPLSGACMYDNVSQFATTTTHTLTDEPQDCVNPRSGLSFISQKAMAKKRSSHELTTESFETLLSHLAESPSTYTPEQLSRSLDHLFNPDSCTEYQIGAFLALLRASGLEGRPDMISMAAQSMRDRAVRVELEQDDTQQDNGWADLVGTGGDGKDTFNVSTTAALVAAGAGVKICKVSLSHLLSLRNYYFRRAKE